MDTSKTDIKKADLEPFVRRRNVLKGGIAFDIPPLVRDPLKNITKATILHCAGVDLMFKRYYKGKKNVLATRHNNKEKNPYVTHSHLLLDVVDLFSGNYNRFMVNS